MQTSTDNPNNLRVIKTARTEQSINEAARQGFRPLVKKVEPSSDVHDMVAVYQHIKTGEIQLVGDMRYLPDLEFKLVIDFHNYYPYKFPSPFAAYLVPADISIGELVWLDDVIEDIVSAYGNQGWNPRLESVEAIWNGKEFEIQFDPDKDGMVMIG